MTLYIHTMDTTTDGDITVISDITVINVSETMMSAIDELLETKVATVIWKYVLIVLIIGGVTGNVFSLVVMNTPALRKRVSEITRD